MYLLVYALFMCITVPLICFIQLSVSLVAIYLSTRLSISFAILSSFAICKCICQSLYLSTSLSAILFTIYLPINLSIKFYHLCLSRNLSILPASIFFHKSPTDGARSDITENGREDTPNNKSSYSTG